MSTNAQNSKLVAIKLNPTSHRYSAHVDNLKDNILIIRDTFKAVFTTSSIGIDSSMNVFYSATGFQEYIPIYDSDSKSEVEIKKSKITILNKQANDSFRNMLNSKKITSNENYIKLATALVNAGLPEEYICEAEIKRFDILKCNKAPTKIQEYDRSISELVDCYFNRGGANAFMTPKEVSQVLPNRLLLDFLAGDKDLLLIVTVCLKLLTSFVKTNEHVLWQTSEALKSVIHENVLTHGTKEEKDVLFDSTEFTNYLVHLADNVIAVEQEFPDFYNLIQQRKQENSVEISARSIMNEITIKLNKLNELMTANDVTSDTFLCMVNTFTDTMLNVNRTIESMHEEAQTQLLLKLSQSE